MIFPMIVFSYFIFLFFRFFTVRLAPTPSSFTKIVPPPEN